MNKLKILKFNWELMDEHPFFERVYRTIKFFLGGKVYYHPKSYRRKSSAKISGDCHGKETL